MIELSKYIIGIDLGTTNCAVSYVETNGENRGFLAIQQFKIPQFGAPDRIEFHSTLPSFCYLASSHEWPSKAFDLPWSSSKGYFVGAFAQTYGAKVPTHLVQSAKSWLCNQAADRQDKILPFEAAADTAKISPVEATKRYLDHIKCAWNHSMAQGKPECEFEYQDIILTVPASFDEVARKLTLQAAKMAGFVKMTLLEEPQAAFYSWISHHEEQWQRHFKEEDRILVCDVGGGTTDFSLIQVVKSNGQFAFQRMAVGDHLLLGGDNMDVAVAHFLEERCRALGYEELNFSQQLQLRSQARQCKEHLLSDHQENKHFRLALQGKGSEVIKGSIAFDVTRDEIQELLLKGFYGNYEWDEAIKLKAISGFRTMGLPYENEPSITKHLAHFLEQNLKNTQKFSPDYILFNGGTLKPRLFQEAILHSIECWFPHKKLQKLSTFSLDLAVARGAAYFGKVRRGLGVRIGGGSARGYYLEIELKAIEGKVQKQALTLMPRGSEDGSQHESSRIFLLKPNTPVAFNLYTSHVRLDDREGDLIAIDPLEIQQLPPIHTVLRYGKKNIHEMDQGAIPVKLSIRLSEIGTLELWLTSQKTDHRWFLEFQLRGVGGQENSLAILESKRADETYDLSHLKSAEDVIIKIFEDSQQSPGKMMEKLETLLEIPRHDWPLSLLRGLWPVLMRQSLKRNLSLAHEARWWNLAGFLLRPGVGYPLDDHRIKDVWKVILSDIKMAKSPECQNQLMICYRRIAAGLNKGQQMQLSSEIFPLIVTKSSGKIVIKGKQEEYYYSERVRAFAAMELADLSLKIRMGNALLKRISEGEALFCDYWALARIGARHLAYGTIANLVPLDICIKWIEELLSFEKANKDQLGFVFSMLARKTDYRESNIPEGLVNRLVEYLSSYSHLDRLKDLLFKEVALTQNEQDQVFGEHLPMGLSLEF